VGRVSRRSKRRRNIIKRMHDEIAALQDTPEVGHKLEQQGAMIVKQSSAEFANTCRTKPRAGRW